MDSDLPFFLPLPPVATFSADVGLLVLAVAFFAEVAFFAKDFVGANPCFLIGSKDEEEVGAGL